MEKMIFALEHVDNWPPVSSEGVWCKRVGDNYQLLNAPCFIKGLANHDVFAAMLDPVNEQIFEFNVVEESGHSLVWAINHSDSDTTTLQSKFTDLGCDVAEVKQFSLLTFDIPPHVSALAVNLLLEEAEKCNFHLAYPVWRHDAEDCQIDKAQAQNFEVIG
jgi:Domain of unknown function (DUF4265)